MLASRQDRPTLDLAAPRRAPDVNARRRQIALGVAGLVVVLVAALFMLGAVDLKRLRTRLDMLTQQVLA